MQTISLIGFIEFPKVIAYTKSIWFGAVLIGSSQTIPFTISNMQPVDAEWHLVVKKMPVSLATTTDWVRKNSFDLSQSKRLSCSRMVMLYGAWLCRVKCCFLFTRFFFSSCEKNLYSLEKIQYFHWIEDKLLIRKRID